VANAWLRERGWWGPVVAVLVVYVVVWGLHEDHPGWFQGPVGRALFAPAAAHQPKHKPRRPSFTLPGQANLGGEPGRADRAEIPPRYLELYRKAGRRYRLPWTVLAGIGAVESGHGQSSAPGVHNGVNAFGCCAGPMQFNVRNGPPSTWDRYGQGGDPYDPADAIPAAARLLRANGAPQDLRNAVYAYNHSDSYVREVLATAARYGR
jgi:Transglycosylase SLT domain